MPNMNSTSQGPKFIAKVEVENRQDKNNIPPIIWNEIPVVTNN